MPFPAAELTLRAARLVKTHTRSPAAFRHAVRQAPRVLPRKAAAGWRNQRTDLFQIVKCGLAAGLAWLFCEQVLENPVPVFGALTATVTVQATLAESMRGGLFQFAGVAFGVLLGWFTVGYLGLSPVSIAALVIIAMLAGKVLSLHEQTVGQIPGSAMIMLTVMAGAQTQVAAQRLLDAVVGAAIGIIVNMLVLPPAHLEPAAASLSKLAGEIATVLSKVGRAATRRASVEEVTAWLEQSRELKDLVDETLATVTQARESLTLHPRHLSETAVPVLSGSADAMVAEVDRLEVASHALQHAAGQVNGICRTLTDWAEARAKAESVEVDAPLSPLLPKMFSDLFADTAAALDAFGDCVQAQADNRPVDLVEALGELAARLTAARAAGDACVANAQSAAADADDDTSGVFDPTEDVNPGWLMQGALLADMTKLLTEIDMSDGPHAEAVTSPLAG